MLKCFIILGGLTFLPAVAMAQDYQVQTYDQDGNPGSLVDVPSGEGAVINDDGDISSTYAIPDGDMSAVCCSTDDGGDDSGD